MRPPLYVRQLKRDLDDWIARGWVPETSRNLILGDVGALGPRRTLASVLAILGVVLLGAAAMSFVAANWAAMGKLVRLVVLLGGMSAVFAAAAYFAARGQAAFAQAGVLMGVALFGVNIMLIGQIYHINAGFPDGLLMWGLGALAAAVLVPSRPALGAAILIGGAWEMAWVDTTGPGEPHWAFLIYWAACIVLAHIHTWRSEIHLSLLALIFWTVVNASAIQDRFGWSEQETGSVIALAAFAFWSVGRALERWRYDFSRELERYGIIAAGCALVALHMMADGELEYVTQSWGLTAFAFVVVALGAAFFAYTREGLTASDILGAIGAVAFMALYPVLETTGGDLAVIYIVLIGLYIIWVIAHGLSTEDNVLANVAFVSFGLWVLYVYADVFGALLDQATFFFIGGVILVVSAFVLESVRRHVAREAQAGGA